MRRQLDNNFAGEQRPNPSHYHGKRRGIQSHFQVCFKIHHWPYCNCQPLPGRSKKRIRKIKSKEFATQAQVPHPLGVGNLTYDKLWATSSLGGGRWSSSLPIQGGSVLVSTYKMING